jgi:nitrogen PTS system EIIA component
VRLSVKEVASLLNASEQRVYDWIEDGNLPAQRMSGEYRINRTELLEWATALSIALAPRAFVDSLSGSRIPSVADALTAGGVVYEVPSNDAAAMIRQIVASVPLADEGDREVLLQFLLARESFGLAATSDGIAIPQVRTPVVLPVRSSGDASLLSLSFLSRPLMISASETNRVVDSIFFLVSPTVTSHLAVLSKLTACINDGGFHGAVKRRRNAVDIVQAAAEAEARL